MTLPGGLHAYEILLASQSPRRMRLMGELGIPFRVVETGHGEESYPSNLREGAVALYLAEHKSDAYREALADNQILLTADTVVWHRGAELGKPSGPAEAARMIRTLSGTTHQVYTGVCIRSNRARTSFCSATDVTFAPLSEEEIQWYVQQYHPFDKAGAYGIQEWIGFIAVEKIVGSYFNVMGLPVQRVYSELKALIRNR